MPCFPLHPCRSRDCLQNFFFPFFGRAPLLALYYHTHLILLSPTILDQQPPQISYLHRAVPTPSAAVKSSGWCVATAMGRNFLLCIHLLFPFSWLLLLWYFSPGTVGVRHHRARSASRRPTSGAPDQPQQHPSGRPGPTSRPEPARHQGHPRRGVLISGRTFCFHEC